MAMSAKHSSKFAAIHWQWWRLHMSEKFFSGKKNPNIQTNIILQTKLASYRRTTSILCKNTCIICKTLKSKILPFVSSIILQSNLS